MTHRHHYNYGEPTITVILIAALAVALAMCRYWCREAGQKPRVTRRHAGGRAIMTHGRSRRHRDVITHHLVLQIPSTIGLDGQPLQTLELTASAPRYSLVMQNPSLYVRAARGTAPAAALPETPPPPYGDTQTLPVYTLVDTIPVQPGQAKVQHV